MTRKSKSPPRFNPGWAFLDNPGDFLLSHTITDHQIFLLLPKAKTLHQILKASIAMHFIPPRVNLDKCDLHFVFVERFF